MKLAIVGIRGLPNTYGGFETLTEYLVKYLSDEIEITVFCSSIDMKSTMTIYYGAQLRYIPITSHGPLGILYDNLALYKSIKKFDKILLLGFGGGLLIPFLGRNKKKVIVNIGGLDWKRDKWSSLGKIIIKYFEKLLLKNAGTLISDNLLIKQYILETYSKESQLIAYGGDQSIPLKVTHKLEAEYPFLSQPYALAVARIQVDNQIILMLDTFKKYKKKKFILIGNFNDSDFGKKVWKEYHQIKNLVLLEAIYDRNVLDVIRSNCTFYVHAHSAGGTNPALVEAMHLGLPIFAFANGYNENTTANKALYFKNDAQLFSLIENEESLDLLTIGNALKNIAKSNYCWRDIAEKYKNIILHV